MCQQRVILKLIENVLVVIMLNRKHFVDHHQNLNLTYYYAQKEP